MRLVFALLFGCALASARAGDQATAPDFSSYPRCDTFLYFLRNQTNAARHARHILAVTAFTEYHRWRMEDLPTQTSEALVFWLPESGKCYYDLERSPFGTGSRMPHRPVSETQRQKLMSVVHELPTTNAFPPIENLLLVSTHQGTNWVTRSYDKRSQSNLVDAITGLWRGGPWTRSFTVQ